MRKSKPCWKEWNCDIAASRECCEHVLIHELLHSKSASYFGRETYIENNMIEEASVELLAEEICRKEKIEMLEFQYDKEVGALRKINAVAKIENNDYTFAVRLLEQSLPERMDWLQEQVDKKMAGSTLEERMQISAWMEMLENE